MRKIVGSILLFPVVALAKSIEFAGECCERAHNGLFDYVYEPYKGFLRKVLKIKSEEE